MSIRDSYFENSSTNFSYISGNNRTGTGECGSPFSPGILDDKIFDHKVLNFQTSLDSTSELFSNGPGNNANRFSNVPNRVDLNINDFDSDGHLGSVNENLDKSALESAGLVDFDGLSLDDDSNWLTKHHKNGMVNPANTLNWLMKDDLDGKPLHTLKDSSKYSSINRSSTTLHKSSPIKRSDSTKLDLSKDYGTVTQIIGVPPLSTSNKDLSVVGKELSIAKQHGNNLQQQAIDMSAPHSANIEFGKMNSTNSTSNGNLLFGSGYILADVNDVQNVAKLQEQSLRMSFSTPLVNSNIGLSMNRSSGKLNAIEDEIIDPIAQISRTPGVTRSKQPSKLSSTSSGYLSTVNQKGTLSISRSNQGAANKSTLQKPTGLKKPSKSDCQSVPNVSQDTSQHQSRRITTNSSNADSYQQSLPNLTRNLPMSLAKGNQGSRLSTVNTRTNPRSSLLPQAGPPTRTASQPTVTSQLKPAQKPVNTRTTSSQVMNQGLSQARNQTSLSRSTRTGMPTIANGGGRPSLAATRQPTTRSTAASTATRQLPNPTKGKATSVIGVTGGRVSNIGLNNSRVTNARPITNSSSNNKPINLSGLTSRNSTFSSNNASTSIPRVGLAGTSTSRTSAATTVRTILPSKNNTTTRTAPSSNLSRNNQQNQLSVPSSVRSSNQHQPQPVNKMLKSVSSLRSNTPLNPLLKRTNPPANTSSPMKPSAVIPQTNASRLNSRLMRNVDRNSPLPRQGIDEEWKEGCF